MVPLLTSPLALAALAAVPLLVAIYILQRRYRTRDVSALFLWSAVRQPASGGRTRERLRFPLSFWLELLAIVLLALAAAGPLVARRSQRRPLVIVLDDSLSMQAGDARERGRRLVENELTRGAYDPVRIVLAGPSPQLAGAATSTRADALRQLDEWTCHAPSSDLEAAIAFAMQSGGRSALVLVVTDRPPAQPLARERVRWQAVGEGGPNLAIVTAARATSERDRVMFEVANFGAANRNTTLALSNGQRIALDLTTGSRRRVQLELPPNSAAIDASIDDPDGAAFDDRVTLLPERRPPLRVSLRVFDDTLRKSIEEALVATGRTTITEMRPELVITDGAAPATGWALQLVRGGAAAAFVGPYVVDRLHPLSDGVALEGIVWGAARAAMPGQPVVLAGSTPLITDDERPDRSHLVRFRLDPKISNLQHSPAWPALLWNLVEWRTAHAPGLRHTNVTLGSTETIVVPPDVRAVHVTAPDRTTRTLDTAALRQVTVAATRPGIWSVRTGETEQRFVANPLAPDESDRSRAAAGVWGGWSDDALTSSGYTSILWLLLLLTLGALVVQQRATAEAA